MIYKIVVRNKISNKVIQVYEVYESQIGEKVQECIENPEYENYTITVTGPI